MTSGFNSSLSNEAFKIKRPELAANSSLMLNAYFQKFKDDDVWAEDAITTRAEELFKLASSIWSYPSRS